jgi:hypothetical protein
MPASKAHRRLAAATLGLLAGLLLAEGLLRVTGFGVHGLRSAEYGFRILPGRGYWEFDPDRPPEIRWDGDPYGRLPPGTRMAFPINGAGLRGPLPPEGRPPLLVVGDSFTFGEGVALEDTFCARLGGVNAGVPGYGSVEEAARLPSLLERFPAKAVLVVFMANDAIPLDHAAQVPDLINARGPAGGPPLRLLAVAGSVFGRSARDRAVEEWYLSYYAGSRREHWDRARSALASMRDAARARGASFGVAYFPLLHRLADDPLGPIRDAVAGACRDLGVPFLDLTPALAVEHERALWVHPTDHHPDARAHALAADALRPFVEGLVR